MSFRDNLQHLRATRNITQEQLAMLLGVSRQSVSKWEAERAYPEMDKLLKLCGLFECTLDDLVSGDLTTRPAAEALSMPSAATPQDVTGYEQAMRVFSWKLALGVALVLLSGSLMLLLSDPAFAPGMGLAGFAAVILVAGMAAGLAIVVPACFSRSGFRKAHPFVEDFYTAEEKDQARSALSTGLVAGACLVLTGTAAIVVLQADAWTAGAAFFLFAAGGAFSIVRGALLAARCKVERYNRISLRGMDDDQIDALDDEDLAARARQAKQERGVYLVVMLAATALGLIMLAIQALSRYFFLAWAVGGLACAAIRIARFTGRRE